MLSKRLLCCSEMVQGSVVADIGTDHAQLPIYLIKNGICKRAYACDIAEGPLSFAEKNIAKAGLEDKITTVLSNGFEKLTDDSITDVVIAGMGGDTIWEIVSGGGELPKKANLVLQPNSKVTRMIHELCAGGYEVVEQRIVPTEKRFYPVLNMRYTGKVCDFGQYDCVIAGLDFSREENVRYLENFILVLREASDGLRQSSSLENMVLAANNDFTADRIKKLLKEVKK